MGTADQVPGTPVPPPDASTPPADPRSPSGGPGESPPRDPRESLRHQLRERLRVVAITDRHLMVPADLLAANDWPAIAAAYAHAIQRAVAGCPPHSVIIQVREKDLDGRPLLQLVRAAQPFAPVMVNDRLDIALVANAYGVHLPDRGIAIADARAVAPTFAVGVSRHAPPLDDAADLLQLGPIWSTPSKPSTLPLHEHALTWPHGSALLVAVGGIDSPQRAQLAASSGADAVAVIRAAWTGGSLAPFVAAVEAGRASRANR